MLAAPLFIGRPVRWGGTVEAVVSIKPQAACQCATAPACMRLRQVTTKIAPKIESKAVCFSLSKTTQS